METVFGILTFIFILSVPLLFVGGVIYFFSKKKSEKPFALTTDFLLKIYLYFISFISLVMLVVGATMLTKAGLSYVVDLPFSYRTHPIERPLDIETKMSEPIISPVEPIPECYSGKKTMINGQEVCFDQEQRKQDILYGATLLISMSIIFALHRYGIFVSEKKETILWLKKSYYFLCLISSSIVGMTVLAISLYQLLDYFIYGIGDLASYSRNVPGEVLSIAIVVIPLWIFFLLKTLKLKEK